MLKKKTEITNISRFNIVWIDDKTAIGYKFIDQYDVNEVWYPIDRYIFDQPRVQIVCRFVFRMR